MRNSSRSQVDPFIVMDVMEAARAAEAAGRHIIHMEVGQPGTPAPAGARAALARCDGGRRAGIYRRPGHPGASGTASQAFIKTGIMSRWTRPVWWSHPGSSGAFILGFTALFDAGDKVGLGEPGYPSYRQILRALDLEPVGIPTSADNRLQPVPADLPDGLAGLITASPANPSGTMLDHAHLDALIGATHDDGRELHFRRDLPRAAIRGPRGFGAGGLGRGLCDQQFLQVFLHDRLAGRLDGRARGSRARGRTAGAEHVHLLAPRQPGGGPRRDGLP